MSHVFDAVHWVRSGRARRAAVAAALAMSAGCAANTGGRAYTTAKLYPTGELVPADQVIDLPNAAGEDFDPMPAGRALGIVVKGGFIKYLQAITRAEVAIFAETFIRAKDKRDADLVYQYAYMNTGKSDTHNEMYKGSYLPRKDITILPPFMYDGQDVEVRLRVIELDGKDNERVRTIVDTAASVAVQFAPAYAPGVSVFQGLVAAVTGNNPDDIELQYDFMIHGDQAKREMDFGKFDSVLSPRQATYAIIKTEHPERIVLPSNYVTYVTDGARWTIANFLRLVTLDAANWGIVGAYFRPAIRDDGDAYLALMGYPFQVPAAGTIKPEFSEHGRLVAGNPPWRLLDAFGRAADESDAPRRVHLDGDRLCVADKPWEDQSYVVLTVERPEQGLEALTAVESAKAKQFIDDLGLQSGQTIDAFKASLTGLSNSLKGAAKLRALRRDFERELNKAVGADQIKAVKDKYAQRLEELKGENLFSAETSDAAFASAGSEIESAAETKTDNASKLRLASSDVYPQDTTSIDLAVAHAADTTVTVKCRAAEAGANFPANGTKSASTAVVGSRARSVFAVSLGDAAVVTRGHDASGAPLTTPVREIRCLVEAAKAAPAPADGSPAPAPSIVASETFTLRLIPKPSVTRVEIDGKDAKSDADWVADKPLTIAGSDLSSVTTVRISYVEMTGTTEGTTVSTKSFSAKPKSAGASGGEVIVIARHAVDKSTLHVRNIRLVTPSPLGYDVEWEATK